MAEKPDPCSHCGKDMPSIFDDDLPWPRPDWHNWLCGDCSAIQCDVCDNGTIMEEAPDGSWECYKCGESTSAGLMSAFQGKAEIRFL